jgi:hypothetical protein
MAAIGDSIYIFGGYGNFVQYNDLYVFRTSLMLWEKVKSTANANWPPPVYLTTLTNIGNLLYLYGGILNDASYSRTLHSFDAKQGLWSVLPSCPYSTGYYHWAASNEGKLYINPDDDATYQTLLKFDPSQSKWTLEGSTSPGSITSVLADRNYIYRYSTSSQSISFYSPKTMSWMDLSLGLPLLQPGRHQFGMAAINETVYVFGGLIGWGEAARSLSSPVDLELICTCTKS